MLPAHRSNAPIADDVNARVREVIVYVLDLRPADVSDGSTQQTLPGWDSLAHVQLVISLEAKFDVRFGIDQALELTSVQAISAALAERGVGTRA